jgi:hypothetical protein
MLSGINLTFRYFIILTISGGEDVTTLQLFFMHFEQSYYYFLSGLYMIPVGYPVIKHLQSLSLHKFRNKYNYDLYTLM